ncbi:MAG: S9 family peptidase [Anaerolineae bacterium]|nr:S9 family peptidase [Anaerolineae bacterium]
MQVPYGLWPSPLTPQSLSQETRLREIAWDSDGHTLVWVEGRSGHGVLVCAQAWEGASRDLTAELSVRARVGYGGGDMTTALGHVYFISGGRIYRQPLQPGEALPLTPAFGDAASPKLSPNGEWVLFVHTYEDTDCLAIVDSKGQRWPQKLVSGDDFYMQPTWHPSGQQIAWVSWNVPLMPWDGTRLSLGTLEWTANGPILSKQEHIAGGEETAIFQPEFSPDGRYLAYISDANGWSNLYLYDLQSQEHRPLVLDEAELGLPAWQQGMRTFAWHPNGSIIFYTRNSQGFMQLWQVNIHDGKREPLSNLQEYTHWSQITVSTQGYLAGIASGPRTPPRIVVYDPRVGRAQVRAFSSTETVPPDLLTIPQAISWQTKGGDMVHGLLYLPTKRFSSSGKPPLTVLVHGGPTSQATARYSSQAQFFATRGYAVLDVNYRGSTGYGRAYRNKLREQWGIYDVDDAVSGAEHLAQKGLVDPSKMVIMGGSAGGYTVLQTLIRYPGVFKAGICLYGVTNLFTLAADTHKFERRYLDLLIGPLPETGQRYRERSPIFNADRIRDPVAIFQGEEDRVVPMSQAETIVKALQRNGIPHEYHLYPGEGHGWRKAETIRAFYEAVLRFLKQYVLFA